MASRAVRSKRTKEQLLDELETIEQKLKDTAVADPSARAAGEKEVKKALDTVKTLSVESLVTSGASFGLEVQRVVSNLTEQAVQRAAELKAIQTAIEAEKQALSELYDKDVVLASTQTLIEEHRATKARLETDESDFQNRILEEDRAHAIATSKARADLEAARKKEQAEYEYNTRTARAREKEEHEYRMKIAERDLAEKTAQKEAEFEVAHNSILADRTTLNAERAEVESILPEVEKKHAAQLSIAVNSAKKDLNAEFALERKDFQAKEQVLNQRLADAQANVARLSSENASLQQQLTAARAEVTNVARAAVEASAGRQALEKVMEVKQENQPKGR